METTSKPIIAYKGFDKDMKCRGFQYEVGNEYEQDGEIKCCEKGFHACESPLEVLDHYDMLTSRFALVEQSGEIDREENTTKVCSSKIKIMAELKLADIITLGIEWLKEVTSPKKIDIKDTSSLNDNGERKKKIGSSGYSAQIGSSGDYAKIDSTGADSVVMCAGYNSAAKAAKGSWITLAEWKKKDNHWKPVCVKTEQVDGERIKADTWYKLVDGEFMEVTNE